MSTLNCWARTPADYHQLNHWAFSGKSNDQILNYIASHEWRSEVIGSPDGTGYLCAHCNQRVSFETCLECGQTLFDLRKVAMGDLYDVAYFTLAAKNHNPRSIPLLIEKLNTARGNLLTAHELAGITDAAAKEVLTNKKGTIYAN
jgi:hypothetical protein